MKPVCDKQKKKGHYITCDGYVTMTDGTGIVHIAPAFGEDDGKWLPDPDMIFDPHEDGYVSPMEAAELKCRKLLDEIRNDLLALRPTAGK